MIASRVRSLLFDLSELSFVGLTDNGLSPVRLDGYGGKEVVVNVPDPELICAFVSSSPLRGCVRGDSRSMVYIPSVSEFTALFGF